MPWFCFPVFNNIASSSTADRTCTGEVKVESGKIIWGSIRLSGMRKERREILSKGSWQWWKVPVDSGLGGRAAECLDVRAFPNIRRDSLPSAK